MASTNSLSTAAPPQGEYKPRYIDIGINLADPIFRGRYHGKQRHPDDLKGVINRAKEVGCTKLLVTGSSFKSSRDALKLANEFAGTVFTTAGIHPCSSAIFSAKHARHHEEEPEDPSSDAENTGPDASAPQPDADVIDAAKTASIIADLRSLIAGARSPGQHTALAAVGEIGLDYDRLHYCSAAVQRHSFRAQLALAASLEQPLPLFLHSRAAHADFVALLQEAFGARLERLAKGGVVHSFTGSAAEMRELTALGLYVGVNGCSFKTAENCAVVREIPLDRLMLETDGPWCEVRQSHEGWKYLLPRKEPVPEERAANGDAGGAPASAGQTLAVGKRKGNKGQKPEAAVPERFKAVKKEKWEEGAMVKGRNEPCMIERVAKIVAEIKGISVEEVCEAAWANTVRVFNLEG